LIEADVSNTERCMALGNRFGEISELNFKWEGMKAVYTGDFPVPQEFMGLSWS
jgi:hypothetical protein